MSLRIEPGRARCRTPRTVERRRWVVTDVRFEIEHAELGGLVFRLNSLLNQLMGVQEDDTDEDPEVETWQVTNVYFPLKSGVCLTSRAELPRLSRKFRQSSADGG